MVYTLDAFLHYDRQFPSVKNLQSVFILSKKKFPRNLNTRESLTKFKTIWTVVALDLSACFDPRSWREKNIPEDEECVRTDSSDGNLLKKAKSRASLSFRLVQS